MPWLWVVAGPNGAGKTTAVRNGLVRQQMPPDIVQLNADDRTRELLSADPLLSDANLRAAIETDARLAGLIQADRDVAVETVLSSDKYLDDVLTARARGFRFGLVYVALKSPEIAIARVALRRDQGGHDVPIDRVRARWLRSLGMLARFAPLADLWLAFDNSDPDPTQPPVLVAIGGQGRPIRWFAPGRIPELDRALSREGQVGGP